MTEEDRALVLMAEECAAECVWRWQRWASLSDPQASALVRLATDARLNPEDVSERFDALFSESALAESDEQGLLEYLREVVRMTAEVRRAVRGGLDGPGWAFSQISRLREMQACIAQALAETQPVGSDT